MIKALKSLWQKRGPGRNGRGSIDFSWVDEFIDRIRPYIFVREEDCLLIKRPNEAQKLNPQGVRIMLTLLGGTSIDALLQQIGRDAEKELDIALFLFEIRRSLDGSLNELNHTKAVEVEPYALGFAKLPVLSEVALTYRCNLACAFCYAGCNCTTNPTADDHEMSTEEIKDVLKKILLEGKTPSVSFTGGEPTIRRDLPELVAFAKELGMWVNLITNGTLMTPRLAEALAAAGLDSAQVSVEGDTAAVHDAVTKRKGSFVKTIAGIRNLQAAGTRVHTNTTINRRNRQACLRMPAFVREALNLERFSMNLVIPTGSAALDNDLVVRYADLPPLLDAIAEESVQHGVKFMWYSPTPLCLFNPIVRGLGNKGCSACDGLISVAPNGDVLPCSSYPDPVGNLLREDLRKVWDSKGAKHYRDKKFAAPRCWQCADFHLCNGACPLYWANTDYSELLPVWEKRQAGEEAACSTTHAAVNHGKRSSQSVSGIHSSQPGSWR